LWLLNLGGKGVIPIMFEQAAFAIAQKRHFIFQGIVGSLTSQGSEGIRYGCKKCQRK
jgi:hypothetical protein